MKPPSPDSLIAFIRKRGETGVTLSELAWEFLRPASASPGLCERILRGVLEPDPRVRELADGRWAAVADELPDIWRGFTAIETREANVAGRRSVEVEVAACRVDRAGAAAERLILAIRPEPVPNELALPPDLRKRMRSGATREQAVTKVAGFARGGALVCWRMTGFVAAVRSRLVDAGQTAPVLQLRSLARSALGKDVARSREETASALLQMEREIHTAEDAALVSSEILSAFFERGLGDAEAMLSAQHPERHEVNFEDYAFSREDLRALPAAPGIYIMRDANGEAVYVGKARNLQRRASSYFRARIERDERIETILSSVYSLETEQAGSELEALLMEYRAIRDLAPVVNLQFDVHERDAAKRSEGRRLIAVLPSVKQHCVEVFMVRGPDALQQRRLSARWRHKAADAIRRFFFLDPGESTGDPAEARIFWSWYAQRRDKAQVVDVDAAADVDDVLRLVDELRRDVLKGREKTFRV